MESLSFLFIPFFSFKRRNCNYKRKSQRANDSELNSVVIISRMADSDEELSDGEIIFEEKLVVFKNNDVESTAKSSPSQRPQSSDLSFQVMKITEHEPGETLVNSTSLMSLSSAANSEDWVLVGETSPESPRKMSAMSYCQPLTPTRTFTQRKTVSASSSMNSDADMSENQTSSDTKNLCTSTLN